MTKSEEITSLISQKFFLNQFIYSDVYLKKDNDEKEFCDCLIEFENVYVCFQIKEKSDDSSSLPYEDCVNGRHIKRGLLLRMYRFFGTDGVINCIAFGSYEWELHKDLFDLLWVS